jgi:hypothetical protein
MIDQSLFKKHFVGKDGFTWWIGQVAPEETWAENKTGTIDESAQAKGFGERYRVRILGHHTENVEDIPDEELPFAYVMYPVTAGGGGRGSSQSANITEGTFVFGWFIDGDDGQLPVIMGCLGYNDYQAVMKNFEPNGGNKFVPTTGWPEDDPTRGQMKSSSQIRSSGGGRVIPQENAQGQATNQYYSTGAQCNTSVSTESDKQANKDGEKKEPLAKTSECEKVPMSTMMKSLVNMMKDIQNLQGIVQNARASLSEGAANIEKEIQKRIDGAMDAIAGAMKWVMAELEKHVLSKLNFSLKFSFSVVFPDMREQLRMAVNGANDVIACVFRGLMASLPSMVKGFLGALTGGGGAGSPLKAVNIPQCFVTDFVGNVMGSIAGIISGTISDALGAFDSIIGSVSDTIGDVLGFISDILAFLTCGGMGQVDCPDIDEWSILSGAASSGGPNLQGIMDSFKNAESSVTNLASNIQGTAEGLIDSVTNDFSNFDAGRLFRNALCDLGPRACGAPTVSFGGPGVGAAINLVVSSGGEIAGADILNAGIGYIAGRSFAKPYDDCGKGKGGVISPVVGPVIQTEDGVYVPVVGNQIPDGDGVVDIIIKEPGFGYLPSPDGSLGGDGSTWADAQDTIITGESDGSTDYYPPLQPGNNGTVPPGGTVTTPPNSNSTEIVDENGNAEEVLPGVPTFSPNGGTITAPRKNETDINLRGIKVNPRYPSLGGNNSYPVVLYLCEIIVNQAGLGYKDTDQVVIKPDYGATATPKFDNFGRLLSVKVTAGGEGFLEVPRVYIKSDTGFNSEIIPKFCIDRKGVDDLEREPSLQDKVITVIDCVGKVF